MEQNSYQAPVAIGEKTAGKWREDEIRRMNLPPIWYQRVTCVFSPVFSYVVSRTWSMLGQRLQKKVRDFIGLSFLGTYRQFYVAVLIAMTIFALTLRILR